MDNIGNKVVIVTGASSGIGEAIVRKLAADGAIVVLAARRKDRLEKIAGDINASGGKALYYTVDVTVENRSGSWSMMSLPDWGGWMSWSVMRG